MTTSQPVSGRHCFNPIETGMATTVRQLLVSALVMIITVSAVTAQPPTVTVDGPTQIADTSAIIAVTINPNGSPTGFYVQWGATTAYGQTGPANIVPIPNVVTNVSAWMEGLSPSTTYHYQVVATNSAGSSYSADMTLTTAAGPPPQAPTVTVDPANLITETSATIVGTVNPNGLATACHVAYGTSSAYGYNGFYTPLAVQNTPVAVTNQITGLSPGTTYHYQLVATNSAGQGASADRTFTTTGPSPDPQAPTVTVIGPTQMTDTNAIIAVTIDPNDAATWFYVRWGVTTDYGATGPVNIVPIPNAVTNVSAWMVGLSPSTTYHYQVIATNSAGTGYSADMTLTTTAGPPPQAPTVTTGSALAITSTNSTLTGTVGTSVVPTTYYFRWGTTVAYGNTTPLGSLSANGSFQVFGDLAGLSPGTTYHYQLVATNSAGSTAGDDRSFTTLSVILTEGDFTYTTNGGTITITGYTGPGGALTIPSTLSGLPVTAIGDTAFSHATSLTSVSFPETLTSIGGWAFDNCTALTDLTLPNSLVKLGFAAFAGCSSLENVTLSENLFLLLSGAFSGCSKLTSIVIPNNVTTIESQTLDHCTSLTNVVIGAGVVSIGERAFGSCSNLTSVTVPASTTNINLNAFQGSTSLVEINVNTQNSTYSSVDGVLFDKSQTTLVRYPEGKCVPNYVVPNGVTNVGPRAFDLCANLTAITLPETLTRVGDWAFRGCGLTRLALPNNLTNIQDASYVSIGGPFGVFNWCTSLTNVIFGKDLAYLGTGAFTFCTSLTEVFFQGNAPATVGTNGGPIPGPWIFLNAPLVTVYYLPGTTGWEPTFSQHPTRLWNPQVQTGDGSFGVGANGFGFNIAGTPDIPLVIEGSTDLAAQAWVPLQNCTLTNGSLSFSDLQGTNYPCRLYRIRSP